MKKYINIFLVILVVISFGIAIKNNAITTLSEDNAFYSSKELINQKNKAIKEEKKFNITDKTKVYNYTKYFKYKNLKGIDLNININEKNNYKELEILSDDIKIEKVIIKNNSNYTVLNSKKNSQNIFLNNDKIYLQIKKTAENEFDIPITLYFKYKNKLYKVTFRQTILKDKPNKKGKITFSLIDQNKYGVYNATISLKDETGNLYGYTQTGTDGKIDFLNVPEGKYIIEVENVPTNYNMIQNKYSKEVIVKEGKTSNLSISVHMKLATFLIVVTDSDDNPISNAKYNILNKNNEIIETLTTNEKGGAAIKDLSLDTYYYQLVDEIPGYKFDDTRYKFTLTKDKQILRKDIKYEKSN